MYVNFGIPADYETLKKLGIDVKGKIVLARYGGSWRGIKPKVAAEHGAIGCIIYSDPHEDGYFQGDSYPHGPFRAAGMIQRGSVMDMPRYPGDPSTPNRPSKPGVDRLPMTDIKTFAPIPVQPISYRDGQKLLERLKGQIAPEAWRGSLPITYHIGPGPARVHMTLRLDYGQRRLINVVGTIAGADAADEWVIVGSHRDAWTFGASDSVSGHVSMMSAARAMGAMVKSGWKPRRTILFISWDGEEQGLLGSTEWVEDLQNELRAKTAVYVNRDAGAGGLNFSASAVHSLTPFVYDLARAIRPEHAAKNLFDAWLDRARDEPPPNGGRDAQSAAGRSARIRLGLHGVPGSPGHCVARLRSQRARRRRHVSLDVRPPGMVQEVHRSAVHAQRAGRACHRRRHAASRRRGAVAVRLRGVRPPDPGVRPRDRTASGEGLVLRRIVTIDFAGLRSAASAFMKAGADVRARGEALVAGAPGRAALTEMNRRLMMAERDLIEPAGLPDRPWYRHVIYAPGLYTGYGVKTIPGVREAVDAGNYARAAEQARIVIRALQRATRTLAGGPPSRDALRRDKGK